MQVQNLECQIAKAQIGRFLAGDMMADDALVQLETHIAGCPGCQQHLSERRAALEAAASPKPAPEQQSQPAAVRKSMADFVKSRLNVQAVVADTATADKPRLTKPTIYAVALAVVLISMSYFSKNMGSMMGPKAADTVLSSPAPAKKPAPQSPKPVAAKVAKPEPKAVASDPTPVAPKAETPAPAKPKPQVTTTVTKPATRNDSRAPRSSKPRSNRGSRTSRPRESGSTIRVYAPTETP